MDQARFQEAKKAYDDGDYRAAAKGFLAAAGRGTEGNGAAYHMAGNALMRLRRYSDAVTVYGHAMRDELYDRRGAARANLAAAHAAVGEYADAVEQYRAALEEPDYTTHYKALQGLAGALMEMGWHEEAAVTYRQAALDGDNPDPGKALNNLGLAFMQMGRPEDAVESYKAALGFDTYTGRGKALANLGIAFHVLGRHEDAVKAFEKATQLHSHTLSPDALKAFEASRAALPAREVVEGWSTGEMPPVTVPAEGSSADDGWSTDELLALSVTGVEAPPSQPDSSASETPADGEAVGIFDKDEDELDTSFFTMTEEEMRERDRLARHSERSARRLDRNPWTVVVIALVGVAVLVGGFAAAFFLGYGYPTQGMTVSGLLDAHSEGGPVDGYWVAVPAADVDREMAKLPPVKEYTLESVERSPRTSRALVTVTPSDGAPLSYEFTLAREGVGWKVTGVENDWTSSGDDS